MAGNNPVALPIMLTTCSLVVAGLNWNSTPNKLPIWWDAHANPIAWAPRWIGLLILPVLQIVISYILYQLAARDPYLTTQSGGSANALANIIALPSIFLFMIFNLVHLPIARSVTQNFLPRIFVVNVAIWMLCWLGYNLQFVEPNSSIGVMGYCPITESSLWDRQHKRAGIILMTLGTLLFIVSLICPTGIAFLVITLVIWLGAYFVVLFDSYLVSMTYVEAKKLVDSPNTFKNRDITQSKSLKRPLI